MKNDKNMSTSGLNKERRVLVLPSTIDSDLKLIRLPHPSNNVSKEPIIIFHHNDKCYRLNTHTFSKGSQYNQAKDLSTEKYHYTNEQNPLKSTFLTNKSDRMDGYILESGDFRYSTKYDLCFSLCGAYYSENITQSESDYLNKYTGNSVEHDDRFLTVRDFQDLLIDKHDQQWAHVSVGVLESALTEISDSIEEAGDTYHKITIEKVVEWLTRKVSKIVDNFPQTLPMEKNMPADITSYARIVYSCNLLVSLIPQLVYRALITSKNDTLDIAGAFTKYTEYIETTLQEEKEKEILLQAAVKTGLGNSETKKLGVKKVVISKRITKVKKITVGKGAIDGFFKKKK